MFSVVKYGFYVPMTSYRDRNEAMKIPMMVQDQEVAERRRYEVEILYFELLILHDFEALTEFFI